jgi:hypothetical protein
MYNARNNFDVIFDMKSQLLHTFLFLFAAVMTLAFYAREDMGYKLENKVFLTNFRELSTENYLPKPEINTKNELINKWLCPNARTASSSSMMLQPAFNESWGPDNVCDCFRVSNCTTATECAALETSCYKKTVPQYGNVYAGVETPYFSIIAAFLLIHISVLLNMTIEVIDEDDHGVSLEGTREEKKGLTAVEYSTEPPPSILPDNYGQGSRFRYFAVVGGENDGEPDAQPKKEPDANVIVTIQKRKATDASERRRCSMRILSDALKIPLARFLVLTLLSFGVFLVTIFAYTAKVAERGRDQVCDDKSMCLTETVLFVILLFVSLAATGWSMYCAWYVFSYNDKRSSLKMNLHMLEDLTLAAACMTLVASFTALSGVHDDTTILFDVVTVSFILFVQSVQHKVMVMRETVIKHCEKSTIVLSDGLGKKHMLSSEVLAYFLHTRLFIFVVIVTSTYVFFERIEPTLGPKDSASTWNSYMRNVALLVSLIPNLSSDISYEFFHMREMRVTGEHMTYTGGAMWRRTIYLVYIILFIFAERTSYNDRPLQLA